MRVGSIRARLTAWYVAVLVVSTAALGAGALWLVDRSGRAAADASLGARIDGTRDFIAATVGVVGGEDLADEFHEYAELTLGAVLLEVRDDTGHTLYRPARADWDAIRRAAPSEGSGVPVTVTRPGSFRILTTTLDIAGRRYHVMAALPMDATDDAVRRLRAALLLLLPAVWVVAGFAGYFVSRRALAPVDRMTREVQAITVRELDRRIDVPPEHDEIRRLATTFNDMLARLEAAVADLSQLTAEASHELRAPVALIRTTAEVALSQARSAEGYRQALSDVLDHAERMSKLVADLLHLARTDAGVEAVERQPVDLSALVRRVVHEVEPSIRQRSLSISLVGAERPFPVLGHADSLERLIVILLDNSAKYTDRGGIRVTVGRETDADGRAAVVVDVVDTGIGIDPADRAHVFGRFFRSDTARARGDGSGLGLAIAQAIVQRHRGTIAIIDDPRPGCHVRVRVPEG